jgi:hypothetical protein
MHRFSIALPLLYVLSVVFITAQSPPRAAADTSVHTTVRIPVPVSAGGTPLPAGTYELRIAQEPPTPVAGQSANAQRQVEFVADGRVVARELAEVLLDDDLPTEGASSQRVPSGTRVEMLKGGEFLRISVKRERERYLIYLPVKG